MSDDLYGNLLYDRYGDKLIVSNEKGDLFVRFGEKDYYTTIAGTKGDWLLRQTGDSIVVRDIDGVAYARAADGDWYISSLPRIYNTSSSSTVAPVNTASLALEQSVTGGDNLSGAAWYDREWRKIAQEHPDWTEQQVTDKMSEQIWNAKYKLLINDIANSGSPEEREQKIREHQWELDNYKASGINVDNDVKYLRDTQGMETKNIFSKIAVLTSKYSSDIIEPDPQSDAFVEDERRDRNSTWGISDDGMLYEGNAAGTPSSREMQKLENRYKLYDSLVHPVVNFFEKVNKDAEIQREYAEKRRQERNQPIGDLMDALQVTPLGPEVKGVYTLGSFMGFSRILKVTSKAEGLAGKAYQTAKEGGKHGNFYNQYTTKSTEEIQRGIRSIEKQIAEHEDKIANPQKYIEDFSKLDPRQQEALINRKWPSDIERQKEQLDILKGILQERGL